MTATAKPAAAGALATLKTITARFIMIGGIPSVLVIYICAGAHVPEIGIVFYLALALTIAASEWLSPSRGDGRVRIALMKTAIALAASLPALLVIHFAVHRLDIAIAAALGVVLAALMNYGANWSATVDY
ncbi:hypothetical protein [Burkholderia gladioli]|uniref:hypothetical protein n=1 Tax=Burkholderia gladioli TaxID=28095 RepID=UPI00164159C6|nr:hypothetical protein [Burkholderia gladioli]MDN7500162.1 hypothetical protein [Burkholderia gladioli]